MAQRIQQNSAPDTKSAKILNGVKKALGIVPNLFSTIAQSSAALAFHAKGSAELNGSKISGALREQIALSTAGFNHCDYCASAHTVLGGMRKVGPGEMALNLSGRSGDPNTQAALTFNRRVLATQGQVTDDDLKAVRDAGFGDAEIVEIIAVTVDNIFTNYLNNVAGTEVDFPRVSAAA